MKIINIYFLFLMVTLNIVTNSFAQKKTFFSGSVDLVAPQSKQYFYNNSANHIFRDNIIENGFLLNSFGFKAGYYYPIFKKLYLGIWTGFQSDTKEKFAAIKLGGEIKFYVYDIDNMYFYLLDGNNFTLNKSKYKSGNNLRAGLGFPIIRKKNYNINLKLFWEQNYFTLDGADKLLGYPDEIPRNLTVHSYGISFGVMVK